MFRNHRHIVLAVVAGLAMLGCERPAGVASSDAALAATKDPAPPPAQPEPQKAEDPIKNLNNKLESMGAQVVEKPKDNPGETKVRDLETLSREMDQLQADVKRLQDTVDLTISYVVGDLQEENRRLREEVARVYGVTPESSEDGRDVVVLGSGEAEGTQDIQDAQDERDGNTPVPGPGVEDADYGEQGYISVKEWGRSPEEVASLGAKVPSLKGMICAVPHRMDDAELSDLGRRLREKFDNYDNIVIEVFNDEAAARAYADRNVRSTAANVLSIQKDGETGKDFILLHRNGVSIDVPR